MRIFGQRPLCSPSAWCLPVSASVMSRPRKQPLSVGCSAAPRSPKDHNKGTTGSGMHSSHRPTRAGQADSCKQSSDHGAACASAAPLWSVLIYFGRA